MNPTPPSPFVPARPWTRSTPPRRALAIRLQCLGDLAIAAAYLPQVRERTGRLDLLTRVEYADFAHALPCVDRVHLLRGGNAERHRAAHALALLPRLAGRYDLVLDLQHDRLSTALTRLLRPAARVHFDAHTPRPAWERTRATLSAAGLGPFDHQPGLRDVDGGRGEALLREAGWDGEPLIQLNPASWSPARQWPHWLDFVQSAPSDVRFVVDGLPRIESRVRPLADALGPRLISLLGRTSQRDAVGVIRCASAMLSEDGALGHIAVGMGVPTVMLFGGGPTVWSRPVGDHTRSLEGDGFDCYPCMADTCVHGDTRCLGQHDAQAVWQQIRAIRR